MSSTPEVKKRARLLKSSLGLCVDGACQQKPVEGRVKCHDHLDRDNHNATKRRQSALAGGKCCRCKREPPAEGRDHCQGCLDYCVELIRSRRLAKRTPRG